MKKHWIYLTALCLPIGLLAGCSEDRTTDPGAADEPVAVSLTANIGSITLTRQTDGRWEQGDAIGLCMNATSGGETANGVFNYRYTTATTGTTGTLLPDGQANTAYFPADGSTVDFLAYHPYEADALTANFTLPVSVAAQPATDLLTARTDGHNRNLPNVALAFRHRLTRLLFSISGSGIITSEQLAGATLQIGGMNTTATCHLTDGSITNPANPQDIRVPLNTAGTSGEAIVLPRPQPAEGVSFTVTLANGNRYVARMSGTQALEAGTQNTFRLTLRDEEAVVEATIEPWQDGTDEELEASGKEVTVSAAEGNSGFEAGDTFNLWHGSPAEGAGYLFTLGADNVWKSNPPLYWNALPDDDTHTFYALHTPDDAPAGNQMPDILAATATAEPYRPVSLPFQHLAARLNVTLKAGTGMAQDEVETATVTLPQALTDYRLEGITLKTGDNRNDITLTGSGDTRRALLPPQTIETGQRLLVIDIAGQAYHLTATAGTGTFEGGKDYTLTVTVNRSQVNFSISASPWTVGGKSEGDAGMEIN